MFRSVRDTASSEAQYAWSQAVEHAVIKRDNMFGLFSAGHLSFEHGEKDGPVNIHVGDDRAVQVPRAQLESLRSGCKSWAALDPLLDEGDLFRSLLVDVGRAANNSNFRASPLFEPKGTHSVVVVPIGGMHLTDKPLILGDCCVIGHAQEATEFAIADMGKAVSRALGGFRYPSHTLWLENYMAAENDPYLGDEIYDQIAADGGWMPLMAAFAMPTFGSPARARSVATTQALSAAAWLLSDAESAFSWGLDLPWIPDFDGDREPYSIHGNFGPQVLHLGGRTGDPRLATTEEWSSPPSSVDLNQVIEIRGTDTFLQLVGQATAPTIGAHRRLLEACSLTYSAVRTSPYFAGAAALRAALALFDRGQIEPAEQPIFEALTNHVGALPRAI